MCKNETVSRFFDAYLLTQLVVTKFMANFCLCCIRKTNFLLKMELSQNLWQVFTYVAWEKQTFYQKWSQDFLTQLVVTKFMASFYLWRIRWCIPFDATCCHKIYGKFLPVSNKMMHTFWRNLLSQNLWQVFTCVE
jgi:hypothetical protein